MSVRIRLAERRDAREIMLIETTRFAEPWSLGMLLEEIADVATRRYTVAVEHDRVIGYCGIMFVLDEEVHVNTLGVSSAHEGLGVARALLSDALEAARRRGVARATLEVAVSNERAQRLYYGFGFKPVGVRKNYYEKSGEDALILWNDELASGPPERPTLDS